MAANTLALRSLRCESPAAHVTLGHPDRSVRAGKSLDGGMPQSLPLSSAGAPRAPDRSVFAPTDVCRDSRDLGRAVRAVTEL